ncbi:MAG TPA: hypothetical protein VFC46_12315 [Humisphaera sp.]|nr:hypothetical protein [Humisphaera sp.]
MAIKEAKGTFAIIDGKEIEFPSNELKFDALADQWRADRGPQSSISRLSMHPCYQQIIGMGDVAIPFILGELGKKPDHWFWALSSITGADPVRPESSGILREMAADWINWGRANGYC